MKLHPAGAFDNSAKKYDHITVQPLASAMGAEIAGVQVKDIDEATFAEIEDALFRHGMIFFRDQAMSLSDQERFTLRFGEFGTDAYTTGLPGHPNVQRVVKEADQKTKLIFGGDWHTDSPFLERPPSISLLYGLDIPPYGGDTMWANTRLAFHYLSDTMKAMLRPLKVTMTARDVVKFIAEQSEGHAEKTLGSSVVHLDEKPMIEGRTHPLVRTHPVTGAEALYVDQTYALGIQGLTEREAEPLLEFLRAHITQPAFTCRLRWQKHTFALWDNRICLHHAFNDHDGFRREMIRTTVKGEVPR
jgi:alpha-ketoglutarate-dependent taurine dioxygenase